MGKMNLLLAGAWVAILSGASAFGAEPHLLSCKPYGGGYLVKPSAFKLDLNEGYIMSSEATGNNHSWKIGVSFSECEDMSWLTFDRQGWDEFKARKIKEIDVQVKHLEPDTEIKSTYRCKWAD